MDIKLYDYRNKQHHFRCLLPHLGKFRDIDINFTMYDAPITMVCRRSYLNPKVELDKSIEEGIKLINSLPNVIMYDSGDSTSLMGSIEILENSNALCLIKNQLATKSYYNRPSPYGKWFWYEYSNWCDNKLIKSYDIYQETWDKIFLSGMNITSWNIPRIIARPLDTDRTVDLHAIINLKKESNFSFGADNSKFYNMHRKEYLPIINEVGSKYTEPRPYNEYINALCNSIICLSPFGMGELCLRDVEAIMCGCFLIKPNITQVMTRPVYLNLQNTYGDLGLRIQHIANMDDDQRAEIIIQQQDDLIASFNNSNTIHDTWKPIRQLLSSV